MRGTAPGMTIEENLALAAGKGGWLSRTTRQEKERFREELKKLDIGLEERMSHPVGLLSGGQRQALTLLMATMNPPKLLLLDEHTAALDPGTAEKVLDLTRRIVLNFRHSDGTENCYFIHINDFDTMINSLDKKSFNEKDLSKYNPIIIENRKKKVNYTYNIEKFICNVYERMEIEI